MLSILPWSSEFRRLLLHPGEMGLEGVEGLVPVPAVLLHPLGDLAERRRVDCVQSAGPLRPNDGEAAVPEHAQMLRDRRLRNPELPLHDTADVPRRALAADEEVENPTADRVAENVERVHVREYKMYFI